MLRLRVTASWTYLLRMTKCLFSSFACTISEKFPSVFASSVSAGGKLLLFPLLLLPIPLLSSLPEHLWCIMFVGRLSICQLQIIKFQWTQHIGCDTEPNDDDVGSGDERMRWVSDHCEIVVRGGRQRNSFHTTLQGRCTSAYARMFDTMYAQVKLDAYRDLRFRDLCAILLYLSDRVFKNSRGVLSLIWSQPVHNTFRGAGPPP